MLVDELIVIMNTKEYNRGKGSVLAASTLASVISTCITNPIEVAKLNYQYFPLQCPNYPHPSYHAMLECSCSRFSIEGSLQSLKIAMPQVLFTNLVYMQLYEQVRQKLVSKKNLDSNWATFLSSIFARGVVTSLNIPLESSRIRLSNEVKNKKINFHGFRITLVRDLIYSSLFWPLLQYYRNWASNGEYRRKIKKEQDFTWKNFTVNLLPGFTLSTIVATITTPLDTLKTRVQSEGIRNYKIIQGIDKIYKTEGMRGLFHGVHWRALKSSLHVSIYLFIYEWYIRKIASRDLWSVSE